MMGQRKYLSEFGLNMSGELVIVTQQDHLATLDDTPIFKKHPCHIYVITRAPRITIDLASIRIDDKHLSGRFLVQTQNRFEPHEFRMANNLGTSKITFDSPYPHTRLVAKSEDGQIISDYKTAHLVRACGPDMWKLLDLEVMYIGQSYGVEGARTAPGRLLKHETLQAIYAETVLQAPDMDVWLLLLSFEEHLIASLDGRSKEYGTTAEEDLVHMADVLATPISEQQKINFTEAALIRYFQPQYNKDFKDTFPNPAHSSYGECYAIDINSVCVVVGTECIASRLWTPAVAASSVHIARFNLHSAEKRKGMFDFFGNDDW